MPISAIVAMSENRVIGKNNQLPWHLPADLRHFKALTMGKSILMGRRTHESIGKILPGRRNLIISRNKNFQVPDAFVFHSLDDALSALPLGEEVMLIGGAELYRVFLPKVQRIYMTLVHVELEGDRYFPELNSHEWRLAQCEDHRADKENAYAYSFITWERVKNSK